MSPFAVIEDLNVPEYVFMGLAAGFIFLMVEYFTLDGAKKGLSTGIVITVPFPAHAAYHAVLI